MPEGEGESRNIRVSRGFIRLVLWALIIFSLAILAGVFSYIIVLRKARSFDKVAAENLALMSENRRIESLARDLARLEMIDSQIRRALGAVLELDSVKDTTYINTYSPYFDKTAPNPEDEVFFLTPVEGYITRGFSENVFPGESHRGIDFALSVGTLVNAAANGWVIFNGWDSRFGNFLIIQHPGDYLTCYGHNQVVLVNLGETVQAGQPVALSGNSGRSSAPHLHFEIRRRGRSIDPAALICELMQFNRSGGVQDTVIGKYINNNP